MFAYFNGLWDNVLGAVIILAVGWLWGRWRTLRTWKKKEFKNRVVLALNTLTKEGSQYKLSLRTIFEKDILDVLQNVSMVEAVNDAISKKDPCNPMIPLPKDCSWYILNAILNRIAEQFAAGTIRRDMGLSVKSTWYTFCLTFETEGELRMHKIRIMLIQKDLLTNFPEASDILLESDRHSTRVQTLRTLKQEMDLNPHLFMNLELYQ